MAAAINQVVASLSANDAISNYVLLMRKWLREMGYESDIYSQTIEPEVKGDALPWSTYRTSSREKAVIFHHGFGSDLVDDLLQIPSKLLLVYQNITPPEYFRFVSPELAQGAIRGREQLADLSHKVSMGIGTSTYNLRELQAVGFEKTALIPLSFDPGHLQIEPAPRSVLQPEGDGPLLLFVGRIAPNKRQEDLVKLMDCFSRIDPSARMALVGNPWLEGYVSWLEDLIEDFGLTGRIAMPGKVSLAELVSYYQHADLYISMSEHEGFGVPLIESMYFKLPILAYAAAAVPDTLGGAGMTFKTKNYAALAEIVNVILTDEPFRKRLIEGQTRRLKAFEEETVKAQFQRMIQEQLG